MDPAGRHALVTGGGRGIGAAIARALAEAGAIVTIAGRGVPDGVGHVRMDVTDTGSVAAGLRRAEAANGPVTILVNNAGAVETTPFARLARDAWDRMLAVNLTSVFTVTQAALPAMLAAGWGRVVNIASTAGLAGYPYVAAYVAAKHGVVGLTRALALETARAGITVNAVCPGYTDTELLRESMAQVAAKTGRDAGSVRESFTRSNPQGRLVTTAAATSAVLFLCGPGSGAMTGLSLPVAGGEVT